MNTISAMDYDVAGDSPVATPQKAPDRFIPERGHHALAEAASALRASMNGGLWFKENDFSSSSTFGGGLDVGASAAGVRVEEPYAAHLSVSLLAHRSQRQLGGAFYTPLRDVPLPPETLRPLGAMAFDRTPNGTSRSDRSGSEAPSQCDTENVDAVSSPMYFAQRTGSLPRSLDPARLGSLVRGQAGGSSTPPPVAPSFGLQPTSPFRGPVPYAVGGASDPTTPTQLPPAATTPIRAGSLNPGTPVSAGRSSAAGTPSSAQRVNAQRPPQSPTTAFHSFEYAALAGGHLGARSSYLSAGSGPTGILSGQAASSATAYFERPPQGFTEPLSLAPTNALVYAENMKRNFTSKSFRVIPQTPERILDAPDLLDDFYLNLIDWSANNILTVALSATLYLWNAETGSIHQLMQSEDASNIVTSVAFHGEGVQLAVGTHNKEVQLWDTQTHKLLQTFQGHTSRVGALSWNGNVLASGSRDATVRLHDIRTHQSIGTCSAHSQEVCGLRWSPDGTQLASGGNDNTLNIWDFRRASMECQPLFHIRRHTAAIKALAWNPVRPRLLASGGGTADKMLRFWDTNTGECVNAVDTASQVCGVLWNRAGTELVTSHGYSHNQLTVWRYPSLRRVIDLTGHGSRVLHLAMAPDGETVVSAAGDETIRFWRCFAKSSQPGAAAAAANAAQRSGSAGRRTASRAMRGTGTVKSGRDVSEFDSPLR